MIGGSDVYMAQNVQTHTVGAHGGSPLVRGATQETTYALSLTTDTQTFNTDGWTTNSLLKEGDVFTISGVYAVNPVTKATLNFLRQFRITANATTNTVNTNNTTLTIAPAIITSGPYQNVSASPANDTAITMIGTASTGYRQNLLYHKDAFAS